MVRNTCLPMRPNPFIPTFVFAMFNPLFPEIYY
jgi:hypothetical protein